MAVESAADRAAMFDADEFGTAARYTPPSGPPATDCTIILELGPRDEPFELAPSSRSGMRAVVADFGAILNRDEVPLVELHGSIVPGTRAEGVFTPGSASYRVAGAPNLDETGQLWTVALELTSA